MPARRQPRTTRQRRKLVWARIDDQRVPVPAGQFNALNLLSQFETQYGANLIGCTAVRIRVRYSNFVADTTGSPLGIIGVRVADDADLASSAPTDPLGPSADLHADWMMWDSKHADLTQAAAGTSPGSELSRYSDVKAMRKIEELGQGLYMFVDSPSGIAMDWSLSVSTLLALP